VPDPTDNAPKPLPTGRIRLTTRYMGEHLAGFIFRQSVTIIESFFFVFFHRIFQHNRWRFSGRNSISNRR
jgi:hypothetical protein